MPSLLSSACSSVGKKFIMSICGLALIGFLFVHLMGNFLLFNSNPDPFNEYSHFLIHLGTIIYLAEAGLILLFVIHIIEGVSVWYTSKKARPIPYTVTKSAGKPSRKSISSMTMIYTGVVLAVFLVLHVWRFKYGPYYETEIDGVIVRDLYRLVFEEFSRVGYVIWYVLTLSFLGFHLRHGFWSAFQSLAFNHPRYSPVIFGLGYIISIVLAVGFIAIPVWIYFTGGAQ